MSELRYSEEEFARILRTATELQSRALPAPEGEEEVVDRGSRGMSLRDIQDIAREVGIDPALVEQAAELVVRDQAPLTRPGAVRYVLTDSVPGTMSEEARIRTLQAIRSSAAQHGEAEMSGEGLEWSTPTAELTQFQVSVYPLQGRNEIQVSVDRSGAAVLSHLLPVMGGTLSGIILLSTLEPESALVGASLVVGGLTAGLTTARVLWRQLSRRTAERAKGILVGVRRTLAGHDTD